MYFNSQLFAGHQLNSSCYKFQQGSTLSSSANFSIRTVFTAVNECNNVLGEVHIVVFLGKQIELYLTGENLMPLFSMLLFPVKGSRSVRERGKHRLYSLQKETDDVHLESTFLLTGLT